MTKESFKNKYENYNDHFIHKMADRGKKQKGHFLFGGSEGNLLTSYKEIVKEIMNYFLNIYANQSGKD